MNILLLLIASLATCQIISPIQLPSKTNISKSLIANISKLQYILQSSFSNDQCQWMISKNFSKTEESEEKSNSIMKALQYACSDQYEITLLDNVHYEYVGIYQLTNILIPVTIKGGAQDDNKQSIRTTMMINSSQPYIIFLYEGTLSLFNLEFNFTVGIDQNLTKQILPEFSIIGTSKSAELFKSLLIGSCVINGLPDIAVSMMISILNFNSLYIDDCFFQNAIVSEDNLIDCYSLQQRADLIIKNSQIVNILAYDSQFGGIVTIYLIDIYQTLIIDGCTIENCQQIGYLNISTVLEIQLSYLNSEVYITNNRFINCNGNYTKAFHVVLLTANCNFSNNEFSGNVKYGLDQRGNDAILQWQDQPNQWTAEDTHNRIQIMFNGSQSSNIDSISYYTPSNSGFINLPKGQKYCKAKDQLTLDCICDPDYTSYLFNICKKDKLCQFDLIHQTITDCPCLTTGDPRAGIICPAYCTKGQVTSECICDTNSSDFTIQQCQKEKLCISELIHQTVADCKCLSSGDPRAGSTCPAYCIKGSTNQSCICDTNATNFPIDQCQKEKACKYDLINQTATDCPCLNSSDPRAGDTCASYCVKDKTTTECVCDTNVIDYSVEQCQQEQACKYDLIHQTTYYCPCLSTGDPRAGGICPSYCTAKDIPNQNCVCDSNPNAQYPPQTCQSEKQCNVSSNSSVPTDSCTCSKQNYPSGCKCPTNSSELYGIPSSRCECHTTSDPRSGTVCPAYCVKGSLTPDCVCDTNLSSYSSSQCMKDKLCIFKLQQQSKEYCPCLMKGDPRAGGICPSYCKSKAELTVNCMCELDSSYPQATCERDKLCIVDLIHQSTTNCPCLAINDPRGESICKQTDIDPSDPDQTDPIIPDPSEKYPETEQEQEEIIKQEDDEDKQKEESTSFQMNWIIYIVGGALFVIVLIVLITFAILGFRKMRKQMLKMNKNKEIQKEIIISTLEEEKKHEKTNFDNSQSINVKNIQISSQQLSQSLKIDKQVQTNSILKTNNQTQKQSSSFKVKIISLRSLKINPYHQQSVSSDNHMFNKLSPQIQNNKPPQQKSILNLSTSSNNSKSSQFIQIQQSLTQKQKVLKIQKNEIKDNINLKNNQSLFSTRTHTIKLFSKAQFGINKIKKENNKNQQNGNNGVMKNLSTKPLKSNNKQRKKINDSVQSKLFQEIKINKQEKNNMKQIQNKDNDKKNALNTNKIKKDKSDKRNKTRKIFKQEQMNNNIDKDNEQINNKQTSFRSLNKRAKDDVSKCSNDSLEFQSQSISYLNDKFTNQNRIERELDQDEIVNDQNTVNLPDLNILSRILNLNSYDRSKKSIVDQQGMEQYLSINNESDEQYQSHKETLSTLYSEGNSVFSYESQNMNSSIMSYYVEEDKTS